MSGPVERLSLYLITGGEVFDFGIVRAEVEPQRGAVGMISADGELPADKVRRDRLVGAGIAANMEGMRRRSTWWRVSPAPPAAGEAFELEYEVETFAFGEKSFSLVLSREADRRGPIARVAEESDDGA